MKKFLLLGLISAVTVIGCGSNSEDAATANAAPAPGANANMDAKPNMDKQMPTMGGPSALDSKPLTAPGK